MNGQELNLTRFSISLSKKNVEICSEKVKSWSGFSQNKLSRPKLRSDNKESKQQESQEISKNFVIIIYHLICSKVRGYINPRFQSTEQRLSVTTLCHNSPGSEGFCILKDGILFSYKNQKIFDNKKSSFKLRIFSCELFRTGKVNSQIIVPKTNRSPFFPQKEKKDKVQFRISKKKTRQKVTIKVKAARFCVPVKLFFV